MGDLVRETARSSRSLDSVARQVRGAVLRLLGVGVTGYGRGAGGLPAAHTYPIELSMRAMVRNPWVYTCVQAIATDLASLPLVVEYGSGANKSQTSEHPVISLLARPGIRTSGRRYRRQTAADWRLSGNSLSRVTWLDRRPVMIGRCVPDAYTPVTAGDGEIVYWRSNHGGAPIRHTDALHVADISYTSDVSAVLGQSPIQPLALGLQVDYDTRVNAGRSARRGRLEMILAPEDPMVVLNTEDTDRMAAGYGASMERGDGVYIPNRGMKATPVSLTSKDGEFQAERDRTKNEILAALGVPPTRAGDPAANYGTAKQQMRTYWEMLVGIAELFSDEWTLVLLANEPGARIRHSFAGQEALQTSHTERQARAAIWVGTFGMPPALAARYEGFYDIPLDDAAQAPSNAPKAPAGSQADEPRETLSATDHIFACLQFAAIAFRELPPDAGPAASLDAVRMSLVHCLRTRGAGPEAAANVAREAAELCCEVARQTPQGELSQLRAFGKEHAERIARIALGGANGR